MAVKDRNTETKVETIVFTRAEAEAWEVPPFQRPITVNQKVRDLAEELIRNGGIIPDVLTFGVLDRRTYLIDELQKRNAFMLANLAEGYADTRTIYVDSMAELGRTFVRLNSHLVAMKPDDNLRGLEASLPVLAYIRKQCPFVGYGTVNRGKSQVVTSMSVVLRAWAISAPDVPGATHAVLTVAESLTEEDGRQLAKFLQAAYNAWGKEIEYGRFWTAINLTLNMWMYRRIVLTAYSAKTQKIDDAQFTKCLMTLSADPHYGDWLLGRKLGQIDRGPCLSKIRDIYGRLIDGRLQPVILFDMGR